MFPIHLDLGFTKLHFYEGFYFLISILTGILLARAQAKKNKMNLEKFDTFTIWVILGAIIGGRLSNFIFWNSEQLLTKPWTIFFVWQGGISITGGVAGGIFGGWLYSRIQKLAFWELFANIAPILLLSQAIGRIGCFLNGDAHGIASNLPWAVKFPRYGTYIPTFKKETAYSGFAWLWSYDQGLVTRDSTLSAAIHPTQIYEMLLDLILMGFIILLHKVVKAKGLSNKLVFYTLIGVYSFYRFFLEFIRADRSGLSPLGISYMQILLIGIVVTSLILSIISLAKSRKAAL